MEYIFIASLYKDYTDKAYLNNPELAEQIFNTINSVRKLGSTKNGIDAWVEEICSILNAKTNVEKAIVINFISIKTNVLRLEFDEEYAEMQCCL